MLLEKEAAMTLSGEMPGDLLKGCERPEDLSGDTGLMKELEIKLMARMPGASIRVMRRAMQRRPPNPIGGTDRRKKC